MPGSGGGGGGPGPRAAWRCCARVYGHGPGRHGSGASVVRSVGSTAPNQRLEIFGRKNSGDGNVELANQVEFVVAEPGREAAAIARSTWRAVCGMCGRPAIRVFAIDLVPELVRTGRAQGK